VAGSEIFFIVVYSMEMLLKVVAFGLGPEGPGTYLTSVWNVLDFIIVVTGWAAFAMDLTVPGGAPAGLRAVRVLRPLRFLQYIPKVDLLAATLVSARAMLSNVAILLLLISVLFDLLGLSAFSGKLHQRCGWQSDTNASVWYMYGPTLGQFCSLTSVGMQCALRTAAAWS
jgi:hypothetical protein